MIELLHIAGCPNHETFAPHLRRLLDDHGVHTPVRLVEVADDREAHRLGFLGSPSLRIDGRDVEPAAADRGGFGVQCRLYRTPGGTAGTPPDAWILTALESAVSSRAGQATAPTAEPMP